MFWQEKEDDDNKLPSAEVVDMAYRIRCRMLPLEHAYALSRALHEALPWLADETDAGVHLIHGAESGNGWMRPENADTEVLHLSRRTRMNLRLPRHRIEDARALEGRTLRVDEYEIEVGEAAVKELIPSSTLFARYVVVHHDDEQEFLQAVADEIKALGIEVRKLMCGKSHVLRHPEGDLHTRSLMVAELEPRHSLTLQTRGLGKHRKLGCGLFIPHKGIAPVKQADDE